MPSIEELAARVEQLEYQFQLLLSLANGHQSPSTSAILNSGMTQDEVSAVVELIVNTEKDILAGNGPSRFAFEKSLDNIKPLQPEDGDPDERASWYRAGSVAKAFLQSRRYNFVREYLESVHVIF